MQIEQDFPQNGRIYPVQSVEGDFIDGENVVIRLSDPEVAISGLMRMCRRHGGWSSAMPLLWGKNWEGAGTLNVYQETSASRIGSLALYLAPDATT